MAIKFVTELPEKEQDTLVEVTVKKTPWGVIIKVNGDGVCGFDANSEGLELYRLASPSLRFLAADKEDYVKIKRYC